MSPVMVVQVDAYRYDAYRTVGRPVKVATALLTQWGWRVQASVTHPRPHRRSPTGYTTQTVARVDTTDARGRVQAQAALRYWCEQRG